MSNDGRCRRTKAKSVIDNFVDAPRLVRMPAVLCLNLQIQIDVTSMKDQKLNCVKMVAGKRSEFV